MISNMFLFDLVDTPTDLQTIPIRELWVFLPFGYLLTILIETPILIVGSPKPISFKQRLWCGAWLTACTYPIVVIVLPALFFGMSRLLYVTVAEIFAPVAECVLFWLAFRSRGILNTKELIQAFIAIIIANLASFAFGEIVSTYGWFGLF